MAATISINTREFSAALRRYAELSKRTLPEIINRKAYYVARRAMFETPKASKLEIRSELGILIRRKGKLTIGKGWYGADRRSNMLLVEAIVRAREYHAGRPQPSNEEAKELMIQLILARSRSIAYFKSGWIHGLKELEGYVKSKFGAARMDRAAKVSGRPKGSAKPAKAGWRPSATIVNATGVGGKLSSGAKRGAALDRYGTPALQRAIDFETRGTLQEIDKRLKAAAKQSGIRTN